MTDNKSYILMCIIARYNSFIQYEIKNESVCCNYAFMQS